jgi:hypothetical protein
MTPPTMGNDKNNISNMLCDERYSNIAHQKQNEMKQETRKF